MIGVEAAAADTSVRAKVLAMGAAPVVAPVGFRLERIVGTVLGASIIEAVPS